MDLSDYQPSDLARAATIPARWYTDPAFLKLEQERIFARTWQPAGYIGSVANPGDYFACEVQGEPIVVARAKDGILRAFSNVCPHPASLLVERRGPPNIFPSPYHGSTSTLTFKPLSP